MTGLTTIENEPYASLMSLILTAVDGTYQEFHQQLCHQSRIGFVDPVRRLLIFSIK